MTSANGDGSLSNLLAGEALSPKQRPKECMTVSTEDSRDAIGASGEKKKKTKRGGKKKSSSSTRRSKESLESSLNDLGEKSPKQNPSRDAVTISTQDSLQNKSPDAKTKKSKRSGKKKPKLPDLETSLTELLTDDDDSHGGVKEALAVLTKDLLSISPRSNSSSGSSKSKKKRPDLGSVLGRLDAPKDFGRGEDDEDTFCGLGTVGEKEAPKVKAKIKSPSLGKKKPIRSNAMMMPKDDSDSEEEDLFESFDSNPFRMPY